jgi:hypothetical protein
MSISDQMINFNPEQIELRTSIPKIDIEEFTGFN